MERRAGLPDLDMASDKELKDLGSMLAAFVSSMDPASVAYGAYAASAIDGISAQAMQRLDVALLKQYRANLIEWMEHALMARAKAGGGGKAIKEIEKGLATLVEKMPQALMSGNPPSADKYVPENGYLDTGLMQPVIDKIFHVISQDAQQAGVGGSQPFPLDLTWDGSRWVVEGRAAYNYRNDLKALRFRWDPDEKVWYFNATKNALPQNIASRFENTAPPYAGMSIADWYFGVWLPANINRFTDVFSNFARNKQSSYGLIFSVAGKTVKVKFKRIINNARDAVEELRYRYTGKQGRKPWLEVMDRFIDLVGTTNPNKIRTLLDRINNLQHSNGLFMEHFPADVRSWYDGFLNAKYSAPTGAHLSRYIKDKDLKDYLTHMNLYGLSTSSRGNPPLSQRQLRFSPPGNYHKMVKLLQVPAGTINWRKRGYPRYKGTVQLDRFDPEIQQGLGTLEALAKKRDRLLDLEITTQEGYEKWQQEVAALEKNQSQTTEDVLSALESQDRSESRKDPLWWVTEQAREHQDAMELTRMMQINFPKEFIEKFPYSVPGVSQSKLAPFVSRYASAAEVAAQHSAVRVAKKWKKLPPGWTDKSVKKFWGTLTGTTPEHKVWDCIEKMTKPFGDGAGAFCGGLADWQMPGWRAKNKKESPEARSDAKSYWKGKMKKKKKGSAERVALRFAVRKAPPMEMGSAVMLKRQGLTPVDVYFGEAMPHRRPIIEFMDGVQDRRGKVFFFVGIAEGGLAILADTERQAKHRRRQLIEDRKHHTSLASTVAGRYSGITDAD